MKDKGGAIIQSYLEKFRSDRRNSHRMISVLLIFALIVTISVFWELHSTGIALTNETTCGLEEHTHTEDCYEDVLICGMEEDENHTHDESCYERQLVCGMEEHTHTVDCISDDTADVETADDWEDTLPDMTGVWPDDVAAIAISQLGYTESTRNYILDEDGVTRRGYTRYGEWAGNEYGEWNSMFAAFCLYYAGVTTDYVPESTGAYAWMLKLTDAGLYVEMDDTLPGVGDVVFFDNSGDGKVDTVGIVTAISDSTLTVVEGDSNDMVEANAYAISSVVGYVDISAIYETYGSAAAEVTEDEAGTDAEDGSVSDDDSGADEAGIEAVDTTEAGTEELEAVTEAETEDFEAVTEIGTEDIEAEGTEAIIETEMEDGEGEDTEGAKAVAEVETEDTESVTEADTEAEMETETDTETNTLTFTASDGDVTVTVTAPEGALPESAELVVKMYDEDSDAYADAGETVSYDPEDEETGMAAIDISFYAGGVEVEPTDTVTVNIDASNLLPEEAYASSIEVAHLTETEDGLEATLVADASEGVDTETAIIEFEIDSFSTYTITWSASYWFSSASTSIIATTYLYNTSYIIGSGSGTLSGTSGTAYDLTSSNSDLAIDGYTLVSASVTYGGIIYENVTAVTVTLTAVSSGGWFNYTYYYTYSYTDSSGTTQLYYGTSAQTLTVSLYYVEDPEITISSVTGSDGEGYILTATTTGDYIFSDEEWTISDSSVAELVDNGDGTATVVWTQDTVDAAVETEVIVTVTRTYEDYDGQTQSISDSYTLTYTPPELTISSVTGSESEGYTLTATTAGNYDFSDEVWTVSDSTLVKVTDNGDGTATVEWTDDAVAGDEVTVTVTRTYEDSYGQTHTISDSYTLTYTGVVEVTVHVTYTSGNNTSVASGAYVALLDSDGNIVATGTTDSNGDVTFSVPAGTYDVEATYTVTTSGGGQDPGGQQSSSSSYSYGGSITVSADTTENVNLTADSYAYDHVDIRVEGEYVLTVETDSGTTSTTLTTYAYSGSSFKVTLPSGEVLSGTAEYSGSEGEYRLTDQAISSGWDNDDDYPKFSLDVSILVSLTELRNYLSDGDIESIFGVSLESGSSDLITYTSETNGVPAGTYIIMELTNYHPTENVCTGSGNSKGYDFEINLSAALSYLTDQLMVYKYIIDEDGNIISSSDDSTDFTFTLTKSDNTISMSTSLKSGESGTFSDITAGYYYIEETAISGYVPVTLVNGSLSESGYIQYIQSETKEDGSIPSVTFYNLKLDDKGVVSLYKEVDDSGASGTYSDDTFTFRLYSGYTLVSDLGDITVTTDEGKSFYLAAGTYTIIELGSDLAAGDAQTAYLNGTELTRVVAEDDDPYGITTGTVYYIGTITVTEGTTSTYTASNTYSRSITIKKVDSNNADNTLTGAEFYIYYEAANGQVKYYAYTNDEGVITGWTADTASATRLTVDSDGVVSISGLIAGTYYLEEITSPDGYNLLPGPVTITISDGSVSVSDSSSLTFTTVESDGTVTITVENTPGYTLPVTGSGCSRWLLMLAGLAMCIIAGRLLYRRCRIF